MERSEICWTWTGPGHTVLGEGRWTQGGYLRLPFTPAEAMSPLLLFPPISNSTQALGHLPVTSPGFRPPTYQMSKLRRTAAWRELGSQPRLMSVTIMFHCPPWTPASRKPSLIHSFPTRIRGQLWGVLQSPADSDNSITAERMGLRGGTARRVGVVGIPGARSVALAQESCDQVLPATPTSTSPPTWGSHVNTWDGEVGGRTSCFAPVAHLLFRAAPLVGGLWRAAGPAGWRPGPAGPASKPAQAPPGRLRTPASWGR